MTFTQTVTPTWTGTGTITVTATVTQTSTVTTPPVIYQPIAYPQPASQKITFAYKLTAAAQVKIYVYNLMGSQVAVFEAAAAGPGINSSPAFDISKFAPGVYFYMVKTTDPAVKFDVQKILVER